MAMKSKQNTKVTKNKTIRFPLELVNKIEEIIADKGISFSSFVIQTCHRCLEEIEENQKKI